MNNQQLTIEQALEECKRRFPIGSIVSNETTYGKAPSHVKIHDNTDFKIVGTYRNRVSVNSITVYVGDISDNKIEYPYTNVFAKVISYPEGYIQEPKKISNYSIF